MWTLCDSEALSRHPCSELFEVFDCTAAEGRRIQIASFMKRSRAKSRDDIMALMHVTYIGEDAVPLQQDTEM